MTQSTGSALAAVPPEVSEPLGWDDIGAIIVLLVAATGPGNWLSDPSIGFFLFRGLRVFIAVVLAARLMQRCRGAWLTWTIRHQPALCLLMTLTVASALWSLAPLITLRKTATLLGTTLVGVLIGYSCVPRRLERVLHWTFMLLLGLSVVVFVLLPEPPASRAIELRGIMTHKNSFGAAAAVASIFFLVVTMRRRVHPVFGAVLCLLSLYAMILSHSRTSIAALGLTLLVYGYLEIASRRQRPTGAVLRRISAALVLGVAVVPFLIIAGPFADALGGKYALHGRPAIWDGAMTILRERPLSGYGYAVVWGKADGTMLPHIPITGHPSAASAHNSIASIATELGIPAAIIACICLFMALANAGRLFERAPSTFSLFALLYMICFTVMGFAESHLLQIHSIFWLVFVALTVTVQRTLQQPDVGHP